MITVHLMGGLGNQLFQIFTTMAYGINSRIKTIFPFSKTLTTGYERPTYWDSLLSRLSIFTAGKNNPTNEELYSWAKLRETGFQFSNIPSYSRNVMLYGYWQSYLYFDKVKEIIFRIIQLDKMRENIQNEFPEYFDGKMDKLSIHFRLGDYKQHPESHPILPKEYYYNALSVIQKKCQVENFKILYFCEAEDNSEVLNTIEYLKCEFVNAIFIKVDDTIPDWKQLLIMSVCNHNIIANSSFSWWGAYMNLSESKIVCYPEIWFGKNIIQNIPHSEFVKDLCPTDWINVAVSA